MRTRAQVGFTLVELMIVVAIVGVLAVVAGTAYRRYMDSGRTAEAYAMIGEFRAKEEAYRAENGTYLGDGTGETNFYPALLASGEPKPKDCNAGKPAYWGNLGITPGRSQLSCGYVVIAGAAGAWGLAGNSGKALFSNVVPTTPWWYLIATCNNDASAAANATFSTTSVTTTVVAQNEHK